MDLKERAVAFFTFLVACLGLALLAGGLGTQYWVVATATRPANNKSEGFVHFGLFEGSKRLDHGFGERLEPLNIVDIMYRERTFMIRELYVATVSCVGAGIFFGVVSALLAVVNTATNPTEAICHLPGLVLWNGLAALGSFAAVVTWVVQYFVKLRFNVLVREDVRVFGWHSRGMATIGHSFWLVLIALGLFLVNVAVLNLLRQKRNRRLRALAMPGSGIYMGSNLVPGGEIRKPLSVMADHNNDAKLSCNGNLMLY